MCIVTDLPFSPRCTSLALPDHTCREGGSTMIATRGWFQQEERVRATRTLVCHKMVVSFANVDAAIFDSSKMTKYSAPSGKH